MKHTRHSSHAKKPLAAPAQAADFPLDDAPLATRLAFVVQLREGTGRKRGYFAGRVEHMPTGQATRFATPEELVEFLQAIARKEERERRDE